MRFSSAPSAWGLAAALSLVSLAWAAPAGASPAAPGGAKPAPAAKPSPGPTASGRPAPVERQTLPYAPGMPLQRYVLANGLTVLLLPLPTSPVTTMHTWVKAGSRDEAPGTTGIAHLFEHMMFRPVRPGAKSYFDLAGELGLQYNASTRFNATDYHDTFAPELLPRVVAMEAERFRHLKVTPELLKLEREAVRSEYSTKLDANPMVDLWFHVYRYAFPGHPYGWHIVGERADLDRITAEDCNRFFARHYAPNNTLIALAGRFEPASALALIQDAYGDWPRGPLKPAWTNAPAQGKRAVEGPGKLSAPSKYMLIGYRLPERTAPDRLAHELAEWILFNGKGSLVYRRLVEEKRMASVADAFNTDYDIGLSKVLVLPNAGVGRQAIHDEVQHAVRDFESLPREDYEAYRQAFATALAEGQLKTHGVTSALGHAWAYDGDVRGAYLDARAVLAVPRAAVATAMRRTYVPTNRVTAYTP